MGISRRNGNLLRLFCVILVFLSCCPEVFISELTAGESKEISFPYRASSLDDSFSSLWEDLWKLPDVIIVNTKEIVSDEGYLTWFLLAGGASIAMDSSGADDNIADYLKDRKLNGEVDKIVDLIGGPGIHFAATGVWYITSSIWRDTVQKEHAWTMLKALSVTGAATLGLKLLRINDTPNGKALAWPSGHTSSSFAAASVLDELYGPQIGLPAYIGAGFVGYRMMDSGDHWASDVLFGAVLGCITGHHVAGKHKEWGLDEFEVVPLTSELSDENIIGISFVKQF